MYGFLGERKLPPQNTERLLLLLDRWQRAFGSQQKWATTAKECTDFVEGRQWDEKLVAQMDAAGRPHLTINKTNRLLRLMLGYFSNNRTDLKVLAGHDGTGTDAAADALTALMKQIAQVNEMPYVDAEVFQDGLMTGRGYFDHRLCFEKNDFGEVEARAMDPFSTYLDPDTQSYDLNRDCGYICEARFGCLDEVESLFGKEARENVEPFVYNRTPLSYYSTMASQGETTPIRRFGGSEDTQSEWWDNIYGMLGSFADPLRKSLRIMDFQYKVLTPAKMFVDMETGDRQEIPEDWQRDKIQRVLYWAQQNNTPLSVDTRPIRKVRWTTIIGDLMVYDDWSPYRTYTVTGFFPYFRRGITRGMIEDLMDPNREINKRRSARIDTIMRTAHSGWKYHEGSLDPVQEAALKRHGGEAGFLLKWKGLGAHMEPKKIEPSAPPSGLKELEATASDDMQEVSGINESALGEIDIGQSGKAIEARQRQAVIAVQSYLTNFSRSKKLVGYKQLEIAQEHYTEPRMFRILGENGKSQLVQINQRIAVDQIANDITVGKYLVSIDERPLTATFQAGQFEELMNILQKLGPIGQMIASTRPDLIVDMSSLPNKDEWKQALQEAAAEMQGIPPGAGGAGQPPAPGGPPPPPGKALAGPPGGGAAPPSNVVALAR